jgi:hypothetical protein
MARREGRIGRPRTPPRREELELSDDDHENGNGALAPFIAPAQLARWSEERHVILLETTESAPNRLHQENPNWGRPVPVGRRGANPPKNCLSHMEYGDIGTVLRRAQSDLNANPEYLSLSNQAPISEAVLRTKYNELLQIATRRRNEAEDTQAFDQDGSHPRSLKIALSINKQLEAGQARRAGIVAIENEIYLKNVSHICSRCFSG